MEINQFRYKFREIQLFSLLGLPQRNPGGSGFGKLRINHKGDSGGSGGADKAAHEARRPACWTQTAVVRHCVEC